MIEQPDKPFVREQLNRLENRINVTIFGAQAIPAFWRRFCGLMSFDKYTWLNRIVAAGASRRPDFLVMVGDERRYWLEVELGDRDGDQEKAYQKIPPHEVRWIVGLPGNADNDVSLVQVRALAKEAVAEIGTDHPQATAILRALIELIAPQQLSLVQKASEQNIPQWLLKDFFPVLEPLLALQAAHLLINKPFKASSLSLRLKKGPSVKTSRPDGFAILSMKERTHFLVPCPDEMARIFTKSLTSLVSDWSNLLDQAYPAWSAHVGEHKRIKMPIEMVAQHADRFATFFGKVQSILVG